MSRQILFNKEAREKLLIGVSKLRDAVQVTLGPNGRNAVFYSNSGKPQVTKDGVAVANEVFNLGCEFENIGADIIRQSAAKTADVAGDGTTTTTILASAIYEEGLKLTDKLGIVKVKASIEEDKSKLIKQLNTISEPCDTLERIAQVANISSNNDGEISSLITDAIDKVGKDGVITIENSPNEKTFLEVTEGMQFDRGYLSAYFCNNEDKSKVNYNNPLILLTDKKITNNTELLPILTEVAKIGRSLLIIANDVEPEVVAGLAMANKSGQIKVCTIKSPGYGDLKGEILKDIAAATGASIITEELNLNLNETKISDLGTAKKVIVNKHNTTIVEGNGNTVDIESRITGIRKALETPESEYQKEKLSERLAKLNGAIAVIRVGGVTETELIEKKARVEDALHATRAAIEEGIVPGGGLTLYQLTEGLNTILGRACKRPLQQILINSGLPKLELQIKNNSLGMGIDLLTLKRGNLIDLGIIDPVKVTKNSLINAVSAAIMLLTTEVVIVEETK